MNGMHDVGGMGGFTLPVRDPDEPSFKYEWEALVFAVNQAFHGPWPIDRRRFAIESMPPDLYLSTSYFGRWLWRFEKLLVEDGLVTEEELRNPDGPMSPAADFQPFVREAVDQTIPPKFRVGDDVLVKNEHPTGHTRVPRYVRGRRGTIHLDHGVYDLPDTVAHGLDPKPQHCYTVIFEAAELWGARANPKDWVYVDLWDDYLLADS